MKNTEKLTIVELEDGIKRWFRYAPDRQGGRVLRMKVANAKSVPEENGIDSDKHPTDSDN